MTERFTVTYHVRSDAASIEARAQGIAVEQSVEMPLAAVDEPSVLTDIVGKVEGIGDLGNGLFSVRIGLALATIGTDPGQFLNMLFGNTSLQDDVTLRDCDVPARFDPGPGTSALRTRLGVPARAFTGSALKPQGLPAERLAGLAERFALGALDFIKDDHGLADQAYSPFAVRVPMIAASVARAVRSTGHLTRYIPSLTGDLEQMRAQARIARDHGLDCMMVAPMVAGFSAVRALARAFPEVTFFAHPSMGGAARIAPELLIGKLFPALGCGAVIFPVYGGRFGYSPETCRELAANARPALAVPAGGITLNRVPELLDFFGPDTMLLIGGSLLLARDRITEESAAFAHAVASHGNTGHGH
ncbi:MAG: ribulose 1,5-bisphosphate carboxylase [Acetobacteraceae bacterium]|nr:ribulose 1,5-bisphosphate carboxylase [Acetobacteraceae bacterium]